MVSLFHFIIYCFDVFYSIIDCSSSYSQLFSSIVLTYFNFHFCSQSFNCFILYFNWCQFFWFCYHLSFYCHQLLVFSFEHRCHELFFNKFHLPTFSIVVNFFFYIFLNLVAIFLVCCRTLATSHVIFLLQIYKLDVNCKKNQPWFVGCFAYPFTNLMSIINLEVCLCMHIVNLVISQLFINLVVFILLILLLIFLLLSCLYYANFDTCYHFHCTTCNYQSLGC
jgi:hypothetical protein